GLSALAGLTLLPAARQLTLLLLLEPLELLLKLFRLAPQLFLLPAIINVLLFVVALIVCQFLLPPRQLIQLSHGVVDFLLPLLGSRSLLRLFVLVLLRIQFEVEQIGQIATGARAASPASAALPDSHLNIAYGGDRAIQVLQLFFFRLNPILPLEPFQLVASRIHLPRRFLQLLGERLELLVQPGQLARGRAARHRFRLLLQRSLGLRQVTPVVRSGVLS